MGEEEQLEERSDTAKVVLRADNLISGLYET